MNRQLTGSAHQTLQLPAHLSIVQPGVRVLLEEQSEPVWLRSCLVHAGPVAVRPCSPQSTSCLRPIAEELQAQSIDNWQLAANWRALPALAVLASELLAVRTCGPGESCASVFRRAVVFGNSLSLHPRGKVFRQPGTGTQPGSP